MWNRGQYQWPDFGQGISDQFVFPCQTPKGIYPMGYQEGIKFLVRTLQIPKTMYGLPLLYLNSGFRRTYKIMGWPMPGYLYGNCKFRDP